MAASYGMRVPLTRRKAELTIGLLPSLLLGLAAAAAAATGLALTGSPLRLDLGGVVLTARDPVRSCLFGAAAAAWLAGMRRGQGGTIRGLLALYVLLGASLLVDRSVATAPNGDGAMIELYTIYAIEGRQLLGPYSQYAWHHPGPSMFYLLAPAYVLSGWSALGLNAGALVLNVWALAAMLLMLRRSGTSGALQALVAVALLVYALRVPALLTSAWNPHLAVMPFVALLVASAGCLGGTWSLLPVAALLASFVVQTHVGFGAAAGVSASLAVAGVAVRYFAHPEERSGIQRSALMTVAVAQLLWLLPLAEQLTAATGNFTRIRTFFWQHEGQPLMLALRAASGMLLGLARPDFELAFGGAYHPSTSPWPVALAFSLVSATLAGAWAARRARQTADAALLAVCGAASIAGFLSATQVVNEIGDYHLFWLSALGAVSAGGVLSAFVNSHHVTLRWRPRIADVCVTAVVAVLALAGAIRLRADAREYRPDREGRAARELAQQVVDRLPVTGNRHPIVRVSEGAGPMRSAFMLQLARAGVPFTVDRELVWLYGQHHGPSSKEDSLLTLADDDLHAVLTKRPGNVVLATEAEGRFFVDAISLLDHPEYR